MVLSTYIARPMVGATAPLQRFVSLVQVQVWRDRVKLGNVDVKGFPQPKIADLSRPCHLTCFRLEQACKLWTLWKTHLAIMITTGMLNPSLSANPFHVHDAVDFFMRPELMR